MNSLPPSLESPGSPQRQPGPCLRPPGPRPPGSDLHDDNKEKEEDILITMIISPEWPGPNPYHNIDCNGDFTHDFKVFFWIRNHYHPGMPLRSSPVQSMQVNNMRTVSGWTL